MKQLLFLLLFPCLALAQYPSNGNQKITLGEQTTADGLIWRGVLADTGIITPSSDTSAYIILDTVNHRLYNYNRATNVWSVTTIGSISSGLTGVLPVANGGTGSATQNFVDLTTTQSSIGGTKTFTSTVTGARFDPTSSSATGNGMFLPSSNTLGLSTNGVERMNISSTGQFVLKGGTNAINRGGRFINDSLEFRMLSSESGSVSKFLSFYTSNSSVNTEKLRITSDGNIGIGTTSPFAQLSINGDYTSTGLQSFEMTRTSVLRDSARFSIRNSTNNTGEFLPTFEGVSNFLSSGLAVGMIFIGRPQEDNSSDDVAIRFDGRRKISGSLITGAISEFANLGTIVMRIMGSGNVGIGQSTPTAVLHLKAGTATASTAPLKFTSGTNLTTAEAGAMEFNGTNLFFSPSTTSHTVNHGLTGSATLDFLSTNAQNSRDLTISVTGAADGDVVSLGVPNAAVNANTSYSAWVSAANTVTVRFNNYSSGTVDPASALFKVFVTK